MRRISPSMLVAIAALVMATTGSAIAAKHYLITSTKQISPKVLKSLHGATGRRGPAGKAGVAGAQGPTGDPGTPGASGANGTAGPAIATRATGSSVQTTAGGNAIYPLTNNTWTQAADEDDIVIGQVTLQSAPPFGTGANQCDPNGGRGLFVDLYVNDVKISSDLYLNTGVSSTIQLPLPGVKDGFAYAANQTPFALSTGADRTATLTAKIGDDCASGGHYVIAGLRFDVIRIR